MSLNYRFSGHETFPCRYTWLPKAVQAITSDQRVSQESPLFKNEDQAMVRLGVGKNMVKAIKFWADAAGMSITGGTGGASVSTFGANLLGLDGHDPFLEDIRTLWLIHWQISTNQEPLFAWDFLLNSWHRSDFTRTEVLQTFRDEANRLNKKLSDVTLENHFTTFLHTYVPTRSKKAEVLEDNLDCPLVELDLIAKVGERTPAESNRRENIYAFRTEEKPEITLELFIYALDDFWRKHHPNELTLSFRDVCVGRSSPGQVFKLPEVAVRQRLEQLENGAAGGFAFQESAALQQVVRQKQISPEKLLKNIYR